MGSEELGTSSTPALPGQAGSALGKILSRNIDTAMSKREEEPRKKEVASEPREKPAKPRPKAPVESGDEPLEASPDETSGQEADQEEAAEERRSKKRKSKEDAPRTEAETETETPTKTAKSEPSTEEDNPFAPAHWSKEARDAFPNLPKPVQDELLKTVKNLQAGFTKKTQALAQAKSLADEIKSSMQPHHIAEMQSLGMNEAKVLKNFLTLHDQYRQDPVGYVKRVMAQAGLTPAHLGFNQAQSPQATTAATESAPEGQADAIPLPPEVQAMQQKLLNLENAWSNAQRAQQLQYQQTEAQKLTEVQTGIHNFANEVGGDGLLTHPHFERLEAHITGILQTDPDIKSISDPLGRLQAAYDRAVWANPETRAQTLAADEAKKRQSWEAERAKSAVSAKPRSGTEAVKPVAKKRTLDEALDGAMRKFGI